MYCARRGIVYLTTLLKNVASKKEEKNVFFFITKKIVLSENFYCSLMKKTENLFAFSLKDERKRKFVVFLFFFVQLSISQSFWSGRQYLFRWLICWEYEPEWLKRFPHLSHVYGFSPVCKRSCSFKWCLCLNFFEHVEHW